MVVVPLVTTHKPVPILGLLPANVNEPLPQFA